MNKQSKKVESFLRKVPPFYMFEQKKKSKRSFSISIELTTYTDKYWT